ncbi:dTMP kinase [Parathermosynechococcus lividus]
MQSVSKVIAVPTRGFFIVLEGGEGAGKTTQLQETAQWLQVSGWLAKLRSRGIDPPLVVTREPGGTALGQDLRHLLLHTTMEIAPLSELLLYAADRAQHVATCIQPQLAQGGIVLCDRFTASTVAYQGYGRGLDLALIDQVNYIATAGVVPDLVLWLDVPPQVGLERSRQRGRSDRFEQTALAFHERVQAGFAAQAAAGGDRWQRIQADAPPEVIRQAIQTCVDQHLRQWYD